MRKLSTEQNKPETTGLPPINTWAGTHAHTQILIHMHLTQAYGRPAHAFY